MFNKCIRTANPNKKARYMDNNSFADEEQESVITDYENVRTIQTNV